MIVTIPDVLDLTELRRIRAIVAESGFVDGRTTAGHRAKRVKRNEQLEKGSEPAAEAKELVRKALLRNPLFSRVAIPKSVQVPLISRYEPGMEYGLHVDNALMGEKAKVRTDLSVTVFLSDPGDYDGGELVVDSALGDQEVKLPAGAAVIYPSGCLHRVAAVTRGGRLAAVTWVQSYVRDPARREVLHDLDLICKFLSETVGEARETDLAYKTYSNLLRRWSET